MQMASERGIRFINKAKPYVAVIFLQFGIAGLGIIAKLALNKGMSPHTFVVYRNALAAAALGPFALVLERFLLLYLIRNQPWLVRITSLLNCSIILLSTLGTFLTRKSRPRLTVSIFLKIMALAFLQPVVDLHLYFVGMKYTTATFATAMSNIVPSITFALALILRMERVNLREVRSQAKVIGTLASLAGAMLMTLYKGPAMASLGAKQHHEPEMTVAEKGMMVKGSIAIIVACFSWAGFVILQAITLHTYPAELSLATLICLLGSVQGTVVTLVVERNNPAAWVIGWDIRLLVIVYAGIMFSGIFYYLQGVVMKQKGPVFVTAFNPLGMIIVAALGSLILAEEMYLGMVMGAIVIVVGLYSIVWGMMEDRFASSPSSEDQVVVVVVQPQNHTVIEQKNISKDPVTTDRERQESI